MPALLKPKSTLAFLGEGKELTVQALFMLACDSYIEDRVGEMYYSA